jgi:hypothetical protein
MDVPSLEIDKEPLTHPHPIWVSKEMAEQIKSLKEIYGVRPVNKWLRSLWQYGIEQAKNNDKSAS